MSVPDTVIAWAAGIFEGEGAVGQRMVNVTQKDTWLLWRLREHFGGTVGKNARRKCGTSLWWVCGQDARDFVAAIRPYLSPRRIAQLDAIFIDDAKRQRNRASIRQASRLRSDLRGRDELGRYDHAKIS